MRRFLISVLFSTITILACHADDGSTAEVGGAYNFSKNKQIRMVNETVRIYLHNTFFIAIADFVFQNTGGKTTVTMGFPDEGDHTMNRRCIRWFKSWVDGNRVRVSFKYLEQPDPDDEERRHEGAWIKKVAFAKGQRRRVRVEYESIQWQSGEKVRGAFYELTTGATWLGKISSARFIIDWSNVTKFQQPIVCKGYDEVLVPRPLGRQFAWVEFKGFIPDFDIWIWQIPAFWRFRINGESVPPSALYPYSSALPKGDPRDLLVPIRSALELLTDAYYLDGNWKNPSSGLFRDKIVLEVDPDTGPSFSHDFLAKLKRKPRLKNVREFDALMKVKFVYIRDVVIAAGGTYHYDAVRDIVDIHFPNVHSRSP